MCVLFMPATACDCLLHRDGGLLLLTVPIGPDVVVWNLHRRYGVARLPHLLWGWDTVQVYSLC